MSQLALRFAGAVYEPERDDARLMNQLERVRTFMLLGGWWTLEEIAAGTSAPAASVSAQLRHLRKQKHGGFVVQKRHRGEAKHGLYEYHVSEPMIGEAVA